MSGISTKAVRKSFISKELKPGNVVAKICMIDLKKSDKPKDPKVAEWTLTLLLEGKPMGNGFVGFDKVYGDPAKGQFEGQSAKVKATDFPIRTFSWNDKKSGELKTKTDVEQILEFIQKLCDTVNSNWLQEVDGKFNTLNEIVTGFNKAKIVKDIWFSWLLAGQEKIKDQFTNYYLFLPSYKVAKDVFALEGGLVTKFDPELHITKDKKAAEASANLEEGVDDDELNDDLSTDDEELFSMDDDDDAPY